MTPIVPFLGDLLRTSIADPREAARRILAMNLPVEARWLAAALVIVLSMIVSQVALLGIPADPTNPFDAFARDPVAGVVTQIVTIIGLAWGITLVGGWFGGSAQFADALLLVVWTDFVLLCVNVAVLAITSLLPVLALAGVFVTLVVFLRLITYFTAYLNGFTSLPKVFFGVILSLVVGVFLFGFVMVLLGFGPQIPQAA